jgi:prephenate dehydratase
MRVAFQGEPGAYSQEAAYEYFGQVETQPYMTFDDVFTAVSSGTCDAGLIPIENSLAGSIHHNYDLLLSHPLHIIGEKFLRVHHCLIGFPGVKKDEILRVISHPQALDQCAGNLRKLGIITEAVYDTAGSVKLLKIDEDRTTAAIASKRAAELYGMQVLEDGFEDNVENYTRFLVIASDPIHPVGEVKTSIVFTLKNLPGALFRALSVFALRDIDLTKIESRPLPGKPWEYLFYIDFIGLVSEENTMRALNHLREYAPMLRVLGSYSSFHPY